MFRDWLSLRHQATGILLELLVFFPKRDFTWDLKNQLTLDIIISNDFLIEVENEDVTYLFSNNHRLPAPQLLCSRSALGTTENGAQGKHVLAVYLDKSCCGFSGLSAPQRTRDSSGDDARAIQSSTRDSYLVIGQAEGAPHRQHRDRALKCPGCRQARRRGGKLTSIIPLQIRRRACQAQRSRLGLLGVGKLRPARSGHHFRLDVLKGIPELPQIRQRRLDHDLGAK